VAGTTTTPRKARAPGGEEASKQKNNSAWLSDPVNQARRIQERCCLVQKLLHIERDFETLGVKSGAGARVRGAAYSRGFIQPAANFG
jgi:hypothetical protein